MPNIGYVYVYANASFVMLTVLLIMWFVKMANVSYSSGYVGFYMACCTEWLASVKYDAKEKP